MPGFLFHVGGAAICPHAGQVQVISSNVRVLASGMPVATVGDLSLVVGCPFVAGIVPQPCLRVQWLTPATRVFVNGQPALLQSSSGLSLGPTQAPQGPPVVIASQTRVIGM
jgi:uncharacterized Zn-binding protein involved in type VI secretion